MCGAGQAADPPGLLRLNGTGHRWPCRPPASIAHVLQIRFSNRFEPLLDRLLDAIAASPASPFVPEQIIVPSAAIRRRIELAAADRFGICSNIEFSFLAQWLWRRIGQVVSVAETSPFTAPALTWRVLGIFGDPRFVGDHPRLADYLRSADEVMRYELASRAAALLEQYLTYRPDWLACWVAGRPARGLAGEQAADEQWQGALWRRIAHDLGANSRHPSLVFFDAIGQMGPDAPARAGLPASAHVFCLPEAPPLYLDILKRLAQWIDLRLYVLNPCREYWLEAVDARRLSYLVAHQRADHHETGNRLLSAWGKQTQAHIDLLLQDEGATVVDDADFVPSAHRTLLAQAQNAILDMTDLARGSVTFDAADRSIEVHVCHSLTRELEVLQDQLLMLLAGPQPPRPAEILVVMPDLESGAALIDAVFGNAPKGRAIPYAITGRPASAHSACAQAVLAILALASSRFAASAVFELLQQPVVARRFGIGSADLDAIHGWIRAAGIRWGIDAQHRSNLGLPAVERHTFTDGLDRLFLGYALADAADEPVGGRLAAGHAEGSGALVLGRFREFFNQMVRLQGDLARPKIPSEWRQSLLGAVDAFIAPAGDEIDDERETVAAIQELATHMEGAGNDRRVPAEVVRAALKRVFDDTTRGGVPGGAVTFASMTSLRALPYRFVCVLGMNDGAFPSTERPSEFDLLARSGRRGDRQRRADDRNVFLDLVLAARERLYLSYTGRSVRDNSVIPPSVLVSELLDYLAQAIEAAPSGIVARKAARHRLILEHPLQPFSPSYFEPDADSRLRSFNDEYCLALKERLTASRASPTAQAAGVPAHAPKADAPSEETEPADARWEPQSAFFQAPLPEAGTEFRQVTLDGLERFFANPCRFLLRARLGIELPRGDEELQDDEPFAPDVPAVEALAERMLPRLLAGESVEQLQARALAGTEFPTGRLGELRLAQEMRRLADFAGVLAPALAGPALDPVEGTLDFSIEGQAWCLSGALGDLRKSGRVRYRYGDAGARDYLNGWIEHLFLNAIAPQQILAQTTWHSRDGIYVLPPLDDARGQLQILLTLYRDGLHRPLHFFPKSAWSYMVRGASLARAMATWQSSRHRPYGEDRDPAYRLALRGVEQPLDQSFVGTATRVFAPLIRHILDARLA